MTIEAIPSQPNRLTVTSPTSSAVSFIRNLWMAIRTHPEKRRAERALLDMDTRLLRDIGIDHGEIMAAVYSPSFERTHFHDGR